MANEACGLFCPRCGNCCTYISYVPHSTAWMHTCKKCGHSFYD